eukprot:SAG11_NODE_166_length_13763_cov_8.292722_8_plen_118_part_00
MIIPYVYSLLAHAKNFEVSAAHYQNHNTKDLGRHLFQPQVLNSGSWVGLANATVAGGPKPQPCFLQESFFLECFFQESFFQEARAKRWCAGEIKVSQHNGCRHVLKKLCYDCIIFVL